MVKNLNIVTVNILKHVDNLRLTKEIPENLFMSFYIYKNKNNRIKMFSGENRYKKEFKVICKMTQVSELFSFFKLGEISKEELYSLNEKIISNSFKETKVAMGYFEPGIVKKSSKQNKLHVSQMSEKEMKYLGNHLNNVKKLSKSNHVMKRLKENKVDIPDDLVIDSMSNPLIWKNIIEYNETFDYKNNRYVQRILFKCIRPLEMIDRNNKLIHVNLFIVYCTTTNELITGYFNSVSDNHKTIDMKRYNLDKVSSIRKGGIPV